MRRKVVRHGAATLTISMPSEWIKSMQLVAGDEVDVEINHRTLLISSDKERRQKHCHVTISEGPWRYVESLLYSLYKAGHTEVEVHYTSNEVAKMIYSLLSQGLLGYEIVEQGNGRILIRDVLTTHSDEIETIIRRNFRVTLGLARAATDMLLQGKYERMRSLWSLEYTINQLTAFLHRHLIVKGYSRQQKTMFLYLLLWITERIGDCYINLCQYLSEHHDAKISKQVVTQWQSANRIFDNFYSLFYKPDTEGFIALTADNERLLERVRNMLLKSAAHDSVLLSMLYLLLYRIDDYYGSYLGFVN